jgi:hypothetical protein
VGDGDCRFVMRGSTFTESQYGIVLNETPSSAATRCRPTLVPRRRQLDHRRLHPGDLPRRLQRRHPAQNNYFGTPDPAKVENKIWHKNDHPSLGLVDLLRLVDDNCRAARARPLPVRLPDLARAQGEAGGTYAFFTSPSQGDVPTPWGHFLLDPTNFLIMRAGTIGPRGMYLFSAMIPTRCRPERLTISKGGWALAETGKLSNLQTLVAP